MPRRPTASPEHFIQGLHVDDIDRTLEQIAAHGGEVVAPPYAEGPLWVARFRDPYGNVLGVWTAAPR